MKEGYWINYETEEAFLIDEHERWIRREGNAATVGIPASVMSEAVAKYEPTKDRDRFLKHLMAEAPIMRVRGHGEMVTFEYDSNLDEKPLAMIKTLGEEWFGPHTLVNVFNFANGNHQQCAWKDWGKDCLTPGVPASRARER
jgi:hypothetical protein